METFDYKVKALRKHYIQQLPAHFAQIEETWKALSAESWNPAVCKSLERMVHQLTGSSASFGYARLSAAARALNTQLNAIVAAGAAPGDSRRSEVDALMSSLRSAVSAAEHAGPAEQSFSTTSPEPLAQPRGARRIIYLVEDDLLLAQDLALQIGYFGYEVVTFGQLAELQAALAKTTPTALVMDIVFPEGDLAGAETIADFQRTRAQPVPVVFISARSDLEARLKAVLAGGDAYFVKPLNAGELIEKLGELTGRDIPDPFRILIVDDSRTTAAYHSAILEQAGMLTAVITDPLLVMQPLVDFKPDMVLMDMHMPTCSGLELAKVLRQQKAYFWLPIVFLSAESEVDKQLSALNRGGGDVFLSKPIVPEHLISVVSSRVERSRTLRLLMIRDSLTELYNHTTITESLDHELAQAKRRKAPLAFAMLDLDSFKSVNDLYGHAVGDHVLRTLSRLLRQRLRKSDVIGRYGGEEFAVILPNTSGHDAVTVLNQLRETFGQVRHRPTMQAEFMVTFSCGIASYPELSEAADLREAADQALYRAKRAGRNRTFQHQA